MKISKTLVATFAVSAGLVLFGDELLTDEKDARATLENAGLKPIEVGKHDPFGCGLDFVGTKFEARNTNGKIVTGNVCSTPFVSRSRIEFTN